MNNEKKWNIRFLELAKHIASWSKDTTKVGAVIVDPKTKNIIGLGYNGFPRGVNDDKNRYEDRETKLQFVCHAELNAILNSSTPVKGYDIYIYPTMMDPPCCPECAKAIVQSGIKRVFGLKPKTDMPERWQKLAKFTNLILTEGGVECKMVIEE